MAEEIEQLQTMLAQSSLDLSILYEKYEFAQFEQKQLAIKTDLEVSNLKIKTKLLQETLENRNKDCETLNSFKKNNEQLLCLLERYDHKVIEMQTEIDVRDLR